MVRTRHSLHPRRHPARVRSALAPSPQQLILFVARVRRDTYLLDRLQFATDLRCVIARIFSCLNRVNGAPELFQQHVAEARIGFVDPDVHEFFDAMIHLGARLFDCLLGRRVHGTDSRSPLPRKPMDALPKGSCRRSSFDYDYYARRAVSSRH